MVYVETLFYRYANSNPVRKSIILLSLLFSGWANALFAQDKADDITGTWLTQDGNLRVKITEVNSRYQGLIVWMKEPHEHGQPKLDRLNPDPSKRDNPIVGQTLILYDMKFDGDDDWADGNIYDSRNGNVYKCTVTMAGYDKVTVRGYMGISLLGQTNTWTRVD